MAWASTIALTLSFGREVHAPFFSNQNTYLLQAAGPKIPQLRGDWLLGTSDPYAFFTSCTKLVLELVGVRGIQFVEAAGFFVALIGVWLIARALSTSRSRGVALLVMAIFGFLSGYTAQVVAAQLTDAFVHLPYIGPIVGEGFFVVAGIVRQPFTGLGGQNIVSFTQPSMAGVLLLPALGLWLMSNARNWGRSRQRLAFVSSALTLAVLAAMLHPTYLLLVLISLGVASLVDTSFGYMTWHRLLSYFLAAGLVTVFALAANPRVLTIGSGPALERLAFERIPHHTLWTSWSLVDVARIVLVLVAILLAARVADGPWIRRWLFGCLGFSLIGAVVVEQTQWYQLALAFPWRISVVLVPLACTIILLVLIDRCKLIRVAGGVRSNQLRVVAFACFAAMALVGLERSLNAPSPSEIDPATEIVAATRPSGVGLVPLAAENVRLNAGVPIYVDWKSHPLVEGEVEEWWSRVDEVRRWERDPQSLCDSTLIGEVDWVLQWRQETPACLESWGRTQSPAGLQIFQRPQVQERMRPSQ